MPKINKQTDITKRSIDGKYLLWALTPDPECATVIDEDNSEYVPKRWTIMGVYDGEKEAKRAETDLLSTM